MEMSVIQSNRLQHFSKGVIQIVKMFRPQLETSKQISISKLLHDVGQAVRRNQVSQGAIYYLNAYELCNNVIDELRNLLRKGFKFNHQRNSLAFAIIKMMQINILYYCSQTEEILASNQQEELVKLIKYNKEEGRNYLSSVKIDVSEFQLISPEMRPLMLEVFKNRQKYFQSTKYHDIQQNYAYSNLQNLLLNILRAFKFKINNFLQESRQSEKSPLYMDSRRTYLKLCYLYTVLMGKQMERRIRGMARDPVHKDRLKSYIYLMDNDNGLSQLLNYFQQAPNSALLIDPRNLQDLIKEISNSRR